MQEMRVLSPTGVLGSGFVEASFEAARAQAPFRVSEVRARAGRSTSVMRLGTA
jgi:hypothetical protein